MTAPLALKFTVAAALYLLLLYACKEPEPPAQYISTKWANTNVTLSASTDTIVFRWNDTRYNKIRSFNYFVDHDSDYVSFYDKRTLSIYIYALSTKQIKKIIPLSRYIPAENLRRKTTVHVKNLDSIYFISYYVLYQMNRNGTIIDSLPLQLSPYPVLSTFENKFPPIFKGDTIFLAADPILKRYNKKHLDKWKVLAAMNLKSQKITFYYKIPGIYKTAKYPEDLYDNNYCVNDNQRFVFSFALDTLLYESDLFSYHKAYTVKSSRQIKNIAPIISPDGRKAKKSEIKDQALMSDEYGSVYFDPFRKRYLRVFKEGTTRALLDELNWDKKQTIIVLNDRFEIEGESEIDTEIDLDCLFITREGDIYARVRADDVDDIYFVSLKYHEK